MMIYFYICSLIFSLILGALGHFIYKWSGYNKIMALFFAVNESVWEHIKIGLTPMFIVFIIEFFFYGDIKIFYIAKFLGFSTFILLIPILFFSYTSLTKKHILVVDVLIFVISLVVAYSVDYLYLNNGIHNVFLNLISIIGITIFVIMYLLFTVYPLKNIIFKDPETGKYGIKE